MFYLFTINGLQTVTPLPPLGNSWLGGIIAGQIYDPVCLNNEEIVFIAFVLYLTNLLFSIDTINQQTSYLWTQVNKMDAFDNVCLSKSIQLTK